MYTPNQVHAKYRENKTKIREDIIKEVDKKLVNCFNLIVKQGKLHIDINDIARDLIEKNYLKSNFFNTNKEYFKEYIRSKYTEQGWIVLDGLTYTGLCFFLSSTDKDRYTKVLEKENAEF